METNETAAVTETTKTQTSLPNDVIEPGVRKVLPATLSSLSDVKHWLTVELGDVATGAAATTEGLTFTDIRCFIIEELQGLVDTANNIVQVSKN